MKKLFLIILMAVIVAACDRHKNTGNLEVTAVISSDSVMLYSGKLTNHKSFQKIALIENIFKETIGGLQNPPHDKLTLVLKLDPYGGQSGIIGSLLQIANWSGEIGIKDYILAGQEDSQILRFSSAANLVHYVDSSFREPMRLELTMPKDETENNTAASVRNAFTCLVLGNGRIYCYQREDLANGDTFSVSGTNTFRARLIDELRKNRDDNLVVIIKPAAESNYKTTVDVLDEMTINKVKTYAFAKLTDKELEFLKSIGK